MKEDYQNKSLDQFYADKFQANDIQLDPSVGWAQFEEKRKYSGFSKYTYLITFLTLLVIAISTYFVTKTISKTNQTSQIEESKDISLDNKKQENYAYQSTKKEAGVKIEGSKTREIAKVENKQNVESAITLKVTNGSISMDNSIGYGNSKMTKARNKKLQSEYTKGFKNSESGLTADQNFSKKNSSSSLFEDKDSETQTSQTEDIEIGNLPKGTMSRKILRFPVINNLTTHLSSSIVLNMHNKLVEPFVANSMVRWSFDIGFSVGKDYGLTSDFKLLDSNNKIRVSHTAINYQHLRTRYFNTFFNLSYNRLDGEEEFVGERIKRIYKDNNLSLGYGMNLFVHKKVDVECGFSFGLSKIDKIEFEQKPTWVDGSIQYRDYTKTVFAMNTTPTYQAQIKVNYYLLNNLQMFTGVVYRTQFTDQLQSKSLARENTLGTFQDYQVLLGIRYTIN
ncbi:MAG: hypothetical protein P1U56_03715 [Saprospiraceae bacterium]|nr:hypothetical protein [Saprospiraceae bacterium]